MSGHTVVIGFGVTGASAARYLIDNGTDPSGIVVVDRRPKALEQATKLGARAVLGDGTDRHVLAQAISGDVRQVVVAVAPDDAALLVTMVARELCPNATISTAVRRTAHVTFVRRQGADHVVTTSESTGTALGHALHDQPEQGSTPTTTRWTVDQRPVQTEEIGRKLRDCTPTAVGVLRGSRRFWGTDAALLRLAAGDQLVLLQPTVPTVHREP